MLISTGNERFLGRVSWLVILGSLLLSWWACWINPIINPDGAKYVLAAEMFSKGRLLDGYIAYKWPFYSLSVAFFSSITTLSAEATAYLFNACMRGVAGVAFLRLIFMFGGDKRHLLLGAVIYLAYPGLNEVQSMIIRDFAYLACFMWMVVFLLRQMANPSTKTFIGFICMGVLATAYRIEGLVFTSGLLVLYLLLGTVSLHWRRVGLTIIIISLPLLIYAELMWLYNGDLGNAWVILTDMVGQMRADVETYIDNLEPGWWPTLLRNLCYAILFFMPFVKMLLNTLTVLTTGYIIVLVVGWFHRPLVDNDRAQILLIMKGWRWAIFINILILIGFVMIKQIVTDRYPLSLSLLLMLFVPFAIVKLIDWAGEKSQKKQTIIKISLVILLGLNTIEGLDRFATKKHLKEAGEWIRERDDGRKTYTNNRIVDYYAGEKAVKEDHYYEWGTVSSLTDTSRWKRLSLMGIYLPRDRDPRILDYFQAIVGRQPDRLFEGKRGDIVITYDFRDTVKQ